MLNPYFVLETRINFRISNLEGNIYFIIQIFNKPVSFPKKLGFYESFPIVLSAAGYVFLRGTVDLISSDLLTINWDEKLQLKVRTEENLPIRAGRNPGASQLYWPAHVQGFITPWRPAGA